MWNAALSTMWGVGRFERLEDFFSTALALGFQQFELNYQVDTAMLDGVNLSRYRIVSVHEPCPANISTETLKDRDWLISSTDELCRRQGMHVIERSVDLAREVGAGLVVVHSGEVNLDPALEHELWTLFESGEASTPRYREVKEQLIAARAARVDAHLDAVRRSLVELAEYARQAGVRLGLENRYRYRDIPLPDEMALLLELAGDDAIGFWYDTGHGQVLENLGFCPHEEWLHRFAMQMIGVHLHDIIGLRDHVPPGSGQIDWHMVARYLPAEAARVCECRSYNSPQEIVAGMRWLVEKGCVSRL